ncbi:apolipoprotein N-acyltransferase [Rhizobium sp. CG5]|uniref:apolipoprotein N-acyltransferase n=1 Tax=Rhizobium sp. CG5 TaxID=2726076 RepID=UPI002034630F|nr:apolipoprotein N-acyltransferase [Rhizobium sp. CG5]MCM2472611.1 apolipoprotein N-acyltransferase [Rhizobium sp. CG5]
MERLAGRIILVWGARRAALAVLAGAFGALALPPVGFFAALFVSFTILVWLLDGVSGNPDNSYSRGLRGAFLTGWLFGFGYFVAGLWWLGNALLVEGDEFAWALPLAILGLPAVLAIFYGLAAMLAKFLWSDGAGRIAALSAAFGLVEWLRSVVATGFPWNAIGYGAMPMPLMMQSAHVIGLFGVTTLAVFVFASPALIGTRRGALPGLAVAALLFVAHIGYGAYVLLLPETPQDNAKPVSVRLVQPVIDQAAKLENSDRAAIFEKHLSLSALPPRPDEKRPDVIVWPETSVPFILTENPDALLRIADLLEEGQVLIAGAVRSEEQGAGAAPRFYNSVYVIDDKGQIIAASDKVHLTPFGEYVPYEDVLRRFGVENLVNLPGGFSAAADRSLLPLPNGVKLYPLICYEIIFPDEMTPVLAQAGAILNVTNDAWFGYSPGPYQHLLQARVRAVENALPVIRNANSGISAVIDSKGRIISGLDFNVEGIVDSTLTLEPVPKRHSYPLNLNFWLILATVMGCAAISRLGFIIAKN